MQQAAAKRRLAAILAADVVGFSRMMGANEEGTLAHLKRIREEVTTRRWPSSAAAYRADLRRPGELSS